jgi:hypothetical protein
MYRFRLLLTLCAAWLSGGISLLAQQERMPVHPKADISKAWEAERFSSGWIQTRCDRLWFYPGNNRPAGLMPSFKLEKADVGLDVLSRLPCPTEPFGLDLWSNKWSDESLKHLVRLEKLHTLSVDQP